MFRRRPLLAPRRGPGILGTVARTAVIAGTATAVSRGVSGAMNTAQERDTAQRQAVENSAIQQQQIEQMQAQMAAMQAQQAMAAPMPAPVAEPAPTAAGLDMMAQLQQLVQMKEAGALTDAEFAAAKAKLLGA